VPTVVHFAHPGDLVAEDRWRGHEVVRGEQEVGATQPEARTSTRTPPGPAMSTSSTSNLRPTAFRTSVFMRSKMRSLARNSRQMLSRKRGHSLTRTNIRFVGDHAKVVYACCTRLARSDVKVGAIGMPSAPLPDYPS